MFTTRAAIGTAETPAAPINGFTLFFGENMFIIFAKITPEAVAIENAHKPKNKIPKVSRVKNLSADSLEPTDKPNKIVTILINSFCNVFDNLSVTPHCITKLPNVKAPNNGVASGKKIIHKPKTTIGNKIFSRFETCLN